MSRVHDGQVEIPNRAYRSQVIRDASRIFGDPGRVAHSEEEVSHEEGATSRPYKGEMLRRVPRCVQGNELTRIRGDGVAVTEDDVNVNDPLGTVDPGADHLGESRGCVRVVAVPVSQHDGHVVRALDPGR